MAKKEFAEVTVKRAVNGETVEGPLVRIAIEINDGYKEPIEKPNFNATFYEVPGIHVYGP